MHSDLQLIYDWIERLELIEEPNRFTKSLLQELYCHYGNLKQSIDKIEMYDNIKIINKPH